MFALNSFIIVCISQADATALFIPQLDAPFIPKCKGAGDTSNFDDYDEEPLRISSSEKYHNEFEDF